MSQPDHTTPFRRLKHAGVIAALAALGIVVQGLIARAAEQTRLQEWTDAQAPPAVAVVAPADDANGHALELPGRLEANARAPIYARVSGYLKRWMFDIGAPVKAGAVLAEVETPDLDQQLLQARADLDSAQATAELAQTSAARWQRALESGAVPRQDADERLSAMRATQGRVKAAQANVERLMALKNFARLTAPFDGVVTARNTDVGALINAGGIDGQELFVVSDTRTLRVYVNVPQSYVPSVPRGTSATIRVPEHPDRLYTATVQASAQSVNAASGTTLMQLTVDNPSGDLLPGGYATVRLDLPSGVAVLGVPASALIFDARGLSVATVGGDSRVVVKPVTIARDLGRTIEISSGIEADDRVIENPPDGIVTGVQVRIAAGAGAERSASSSAIARLDDGRERGIRTVSKRLAREHDEARRILQRPAPLLPPPAKH